MKLPYIVPGVSTCRDNSRTVSRRIWNRTEKANVVFQDSELSIARNIEDPYGHRLK